MKKILIIGAGRSSATLIQYLAEKSREYRMGISLWATAI